MRRFLYLLFGGVFVYTGALKAADPMAFLEDVRSFDLLSDPWAAWLALALPWLEIFSGIAVASGVLRAGGLGILNALLILFLVAISSAWFRGIDLRCGCFGHTDATSSYRDLIVRDLLLLGAGLMLAWRGKSSARGMAQRVCADDGSNHQ